MNLLVTHGAKKNVGDYLIHHRGLRIIDRLLPGAARRSVPRWQRLDADDLREADALVLCGGPGLREDFAPTMFPLVDDALRAGVPVLLLAQGWSGEPADRPNAFRFSEPSRQRLAAIAAAGVWHAVRDDISLDLLRRAEVGEVRRSGCTAWYHLPSLGTSPPNARRVDRLVFTPPADPRLLVETSRVMMLLSRRYPKAERSCVFHRGIHHDHETKRRVAAVYRTWASLAARLGYRVVDAGYDLGQIDFYGASDLHVGYRVHAHLAFLSQRRPSILIAEDGRGAGQAATLHDPHALRAGGRDLIDRLSEVLDVEERGHFASLDAAVDEIERTWPVMEDAVLQLNGAVRSRRSR